MYETEGEGSAFLLEGAASGVVDRRAKLPLNPGRDYEIKYSDEHDDHFLVSASLQLTAWVPW